MMYRGCIFDLDGTLADTLHSIAYFGNRALAQLDLPPIDPEDYRMLVGNGADRLILRMLEKTGGSLDLAARLRQLYDGLYESDPMHLVTAYPGIPQLLCAMEQRGMQAAVLSNKPDYMTRAIVGALFPRNTFTWVMGQRTDVPKKPDPTAVRLILSKMKLPPQDVLYVGDSGVDMETGTRAQLATAGVLWGFRQKEELLEHGAQFLVSTAQELTRILFQL